VSDPKSRLEVWLRSAVKVKGAEGVMYTTWEQKYGDLEKFIEALRGYKYGVPVHNSLPDRGL
jgi:hypothetical protein